MGLISVGVSLMLISLALMIGIPLMVKVGPEAIYGDYLKQLDPMFKLMSNSSLGNFSGLEEQVGSLTNPVVSSGIAPILGTVLSLMPLVFLVGLLLTLLGVVKRVAGMRRAG